MRALMPAAMICLSSCVPAGYSPGCPVYPGCPGYLGYPGCPGPDYPGYPESPYFLLSQILSQTYRTAA